MPMAPMTDFAVKDNYPYLQGFGSYHSSEAISGANPLVNNSPQKPPYGLRTERISGTSFTAPRDQNLQTWIYRVNSSLDREQFVPYDKDPNAAERAPHILSPNSYMWPTLPFPSDSDWLSQRLLGRTGDPATKTGLGIWVFAVDKSMETNTVFSSLDGDSLIIPQAGTLDIQTELGRLLVRQNEFCVIPRAVRYRVTLPNGPCRGYICELFQGHFRLPELGPIGSTGLANVRDFQIPTAYFDGKKEGATIAVPQDEDFAIISRQAGRLWHCTQDHTPFDVVAWHGTFYPYKYDFARYCVLGNMAFDEHDPSLYAVLSAPSNREPGTSVVDFALIPPRWQVSENTLWLPYYHRNTMSEFFAPIVNSQDEKHPFNQAKGWAPFAAGLEPPMTTHGATELEFQQATNAELKPTKLMADGYSVFLLETEMPLYLSEWAAGAAVTNWRAASKKTAASKI